LRTKQTTSKKNVGGSSFLVQDSTRKIKWKITDETRNIAGFEYRSANKLKMDSVNVVAFYTDEITTSGGPESFSGLHGMILGVAIPHEHITWFATKVYDENVRASSLLRLPKAKRLQMLHCCYN
jgi:GLPGLI family protein